MNYNRQVELLYRENGWPFRTEEEKWRWHERDLNDSTILAASRVMGFMPHKIWNNWFYVVMLKTISTEIGPVEHLYVRRGDGRPVHNWSAMQQIKDEIIGEDRVAVEVYPAKDNLIDEADMYHMWVLPVGYQLPFGLHKGVPS